MEGEITIKDLYDIIDKRITSLEVEVREYNRSFVRFEEGKVSDLIQRVTVLEQENKTLKLKDAGFDSDSEKRKDWMWGAAEKIIFMIIGVVISLGVLLLQNTHILNLTPVK